MSRRHLNQQAELQPQIIAERKPLRPVHVVAVQRPVKVTKPISLGGEMIPASRVRN